jgi:hypothetical protein
MDATGARELRDDLAEWVDRFPVLGRADLAAVASTIAAHLPDVGQPERITAGLVTLWTLAFDALVDDGGLDNAILDALTTWYGTIVARAPEAPPSPPARAPAPGVDLGHVLTVLGQRLAAARTFPTLAPVWRTSFAQMVTAIVAQRRLSLRASAVPTVVDLLTLTQESIGVAHYLAVCWILYDDLCIAARLAHLTDLAATCAGAIRLANDLRTWAREEQEGTVNLVVVEAATIGQRNPVLTAAECRKRALWTLATRLPDEVAHLRVLQATSPVPDGAPEMGMVRLVQVVTGAYATHDYRYTGQGNSAEA